jgi:hypothetical protein
MGAEPGSQTEPRLLEMGSEIFCANTASGLNHKLRVTKPDW